jgi:tRNA A37 threonylcarbamoyladenosine dehydratase
LGVGALGATIAELMVRAGVKDIYTVDPDLLSAGNICRHPATLSDVGSAKVKALATRLRQISPFVKVTEAGGALPSDPLALVTALDPYDVVIDCTASDDASLLLAESMVAASSDICLLLTRVRRTAPLRVWCDRKSVPGKGVSRHASTVVI